MCICLLTQLFLSGKIAVYISLRSVLESKVSLLSPAELGVLVVLKHLRESGICVITDTRSCVIKKSGGLLFCCLLGGAKLQILALHFFHGRLVQSVPAHGNQSADVSQNRHAQPQERAHPEQPVG